MLKGGQECYVAIKVHYLSVLNWITVQNMQPLGVLWFKGTAHGCATAHGQCYWNNLGIAKRQCENWKECKYIYQSDKYSPAKSGHPVYWARREGESGFSAGDTLWKMKGNIILEDVMQHQPEQFNMIIIKADIIAVSNTFTCFYSW